MRKYHRDVAHDPRFFADVIHLGALGFIPEPAGKVRVIAMVDC